MTIFFLQFKALMLLFIYNALYDQSYLGSKNNYDYW